MDYKLVVTIIGLGFVIVEVAFGRFFFAGRSRPRDWVIELIATSALPLLIVPSVLYASAALTDLVAPQARGSLAHLSPWLMFGILLIADDLMQYTWHRMAHSVPGLYRFHRAHHSAEYLSVRCVYRNHLLYYATLPGLWFSGVLLHMGFGPVYATYFIAKMTVIIAAHSSAPWDEKLLRIRWLRPVMWVVVRTISTPSTHSAHHGKHVADGVTHYKGNYGNFLFLWDVLFGTAKITGRRPDAYGLEDIEPSPWWREVLL